MKVSFTSHTLKCAALKQALPVQRLAASISRPHINLHVMLLISHVVPAAHPMAPGESLFEPGSSQRTSSPHHSKKAVKSRQTSTKCVLNKIAHPKIFKDKSSRASHQGPGSAGAVGKRPGSAGAAGKRPGSAAACGQAAVRLSQAELRTNASLWVAATNEEDKLVDRNFGDKDEQPAQPTQQRAQPSANVYSDAAMRKRKVWQQAVPAACDWHV